MRVLVVLAAATACMGMPGFTNVRGGGQTMLGDIVQEVSKMLNSDTVHSDKNITN